MGVSLAAVDCHLRFFDQFMADTLAPAIVNLAGRIAEPLFLHRLQMDDGDAVIGDFLQQRVVSRSATSSANVCRPASRKGFA